MTGFNITEDMVGKHTFDDGFAHDFLPHLYDMGFDYWMPMSFNAVWGTDDIQKLMAYYLSSGVLTFKLNGTIDVSGLCQSALIQNGVLVLDYFNTHELMYNFDFKVRDKFYNYTGRKYNIQLWNLLTSHTTCFGTITSGGRLVSTSVVYFKLGSALKFLSSFQLV